MKTIPIKNGFLSLAESKATCPKCYKPVDFDVLEKKWHTKKERSIMFHTCSCEYKMGIAVNMMGDYVSFQIKPNKTKSTLWDNISTKSKE